MAGRNSFMKYSQWIGIAAALLLITSCFLPWTFYPDLNQNFTGFFSANNDYGKPGKVFVSFAVVAIVFYYLPKVWAKRWNLFIGALTGAWALRCFILYSGCYKAICPEKKIGLWLMVLASAIMLVMTFLPDMGVKQSAEPGKKST